MVPPSDGAARWAGEGARADMGAAGDPREPPSYDRRRRDIDEVPTMTHAATPAPLVRAHGRLDA